MHISLSTRMTCILLLSLLCCRLHAQQADSTRLSLHDAEKLLLEKNIPLLVQRYNIDAAKADVITAKLYDNPQVSFENVIYNQTNHKWFDLSYEGENTFQLQQVIKLAGQRNKAVKLAQQNVKMTEYQFYDLMRTLRYELRDNFFKIYYLQQSLQLFHTQVNTLEAMLKAFEDQQKKGNISMKEMLRIKSLLYDLRSDEDEVLQDLQDAQSDFKLLVRLPATAQVIPTLGDDMEQQLAKNYTYQYLLDSARNNRYDYKTAEANIEYNELNYKLQKSMAVPDLQIGFNYDKQGNFTRNYNALTLSMPLPVFNRNQGNIKLAKTMLESSKLQKVGNEDQLQQEVMNSYNTAIRTENLLGTVDPSFGNDFTKLIGEVQRNYQLRNISLLEFVDLYDAYRNSILKINTLRYNHASALEAINFSTGSLIFNPTKN
ncbi:cobalt-zinc-cadmium efflux system outer membrane protein [Chitinophaga skermanii]|uniref:Cobalt-zinc-cadmium efflux system outer membrane protein n=1 Tax=Chitinophaga skermanii TaxID=331697 RepID=A0A327Q771_9BACT|nr:TolC family protein [Chitinophaga skermanii]RAI99713.1 cobalt-zinc-cadmium efflux system outer membrane protein [Chitinophaga skermanii]